MQIKLNGTLYECQKMITHIQDYGWDMRDNEELLMRMSHAEADALFVNGIEWSYLLDDGTEVDRSEYSLAGEIIDHRNGTVSVRMGKPTAIEKELADAKLALALLGVTELEEVTDDVS